MTSVICEWYIKISRHIVCYPLSFVRVDRQKLSENVSFCKEENNNNNNNALINSGIQQVYLYLLYFVKCLNQK